MTPAGRPRRYEPGTRDRISINLNTETVERVRELADKTGQTVGEIVEQALAAYVASAKKGARK